MHRRKIFSNNFLFNSQMAGHVTQIVVTPKMGKNLWFGQFGEVVLLRSKT